jgi:hypothetical protein
LHNDGEWDWIFSAAFWSMRFRTSADPGYELIDNELRMNSLGLVGQRRLDGFLWTMRSG